LSLADIEDGQRAGVSASESVELREARKRVWMLEQEVEVLRRAAAYFAKDMSPKWGTPLVLDLAAEGIPVAVAYRVLKFSKKAFYAWKKHPVTQRDWDDAHLLNAAVDIHRGDPEFGYRFILPASERRDAGRCEPHRTPGQDDCRRHATHPVDLLRRSGPGLVRGFVPAGDARNGYLASTWRGDRPRSTTSNGACWRGLGAGQRDA
jgi:hypothetical protein